VAGGGWRRPKPLKTGFQEAVGTLKIDDFGARRRGFGPFLVCFLFDFGADPVALLNPSWPASRPSPPAASRRRQPPAALPPRFVAAERHNPEERHTVGSLSSICIDSI